MFDHPGLVADDPYRRPGYFGPPVHAATAPIEATFAVFPAHGGCGATTVTALLDPEDAELAVEMRDGQVMPPGWTPVVVARSHAYGAASACELISRWPTGLPRPWLVVVPDAPMRPAAAARFYLRAVRDRAAGVVTVPYLYRLRTVVNIGDALTDRAVAHASRALLQTLRASQRKAP